MIISPISVHQMPLLKFYTVKSVLGEVPCIKVEPVLDGDGIFVSKGRIFIWLTDDERRIPVLMECEIALGSIKAKLLEAK